MGHQVVYGIEYAPHIMADLLIKLSSPAPSAGPGHFHLCLVFQVCPVWPFEWPGYSDISLPHSHILIAQSRAVNVIWRSIYDQDPSSHKNPACQSFFKIAKLIFKSCSHYHVAVTNSTTFTLPVQLTSSHATYNLFPLLQLSP